MMLGDGKQVISKVEKEFELVTKLKTHNYTSTVKRSTTTRPPLYLSPSCRFVTMTKMNSKFSSKADDEKNFAFITLTTKEAGDDLLNNNLSYHSKKLKLSIPMELRISTTLVVNNLP